MSLERDLMDLDETLMRNDDCVHHSDHITIFLLANDARELEQERDTLKEENEKLRELVSHLMYVKPADVTAIVHDGKLLRFDEMLAEVGMRFEVDDE